ncbi:MAG: hypothetical protein SCH98_17830 [Deferrisomatales bacterium]|nr:hypothetical protein [Deferrisomatales bacterium]
MDLNVPTLRPKADSAAASGACGRGIEALRINVGKAGRAARRFVRLDLFLLLPLMLAVPKCKQLFSRVSRTVDDPAQPIADPPPREQKVLELMIGRYFFHAERGDWPGHCQSIPIRKIMPDWLYARWLDLLELFEQGWKSVVWRHETTKYYRIQTKFLGSLRAKLKVLEYFRLFRTLKRHGYQEGKGLPMILLAEGAAFVRVDGAHRSTVLRHLGYAEVPVHVLRLSDLELLPVESDEEAKAVRWFKERCEREGPLEAKS